MIGTDLLAAAQKIAPELSKIRRDLHRHPELGTEVHRTVGVVEEILRSLGILTQRVAGTGLVGLLEGSGPGKTVALRADMDALPLLDAKQVDYASTVNGKMHACGHDVHTSGLLGAAMLLHSRKSQFTGNVKFLFQPAEETTGGALPMIREGVMENPTVDAVFGLHCAPEIPVGKIGVSYGKSYAAADSFDAVIHGKSCHGAAPHNGIDAIFIGAQVVSALQGYVSRNVNPVDSAVITIVQFTGGSARNIVADKVELAGIIRTLEPATRESAAAAVKTIIEGVAGSLGATVDIRFTAGYPCLINDDTMVNCVKRAAAELLGPENVCIIEKPTMGVEDFAYFAQHAPGAFFSLGVSNESRGINQPLHTTLFDVDEAALSVAAALHAQIALSFLAAD